jgi:hypothetical protein
MILSFKLGMPNNNAWNGKWTGEDSIYAKVINFGRSKKAEIRAQELIDNSSYYYNFGDGWGASVTVEEVDNAIARKIRKQSQGFCGYDWMIDSIRTHGEIRSS